MRSGSDLNWLEWGESAKLEEMSSRKILREVAIETGIYHL